jgi:hypothetical protein
MRQFANSVTAKNLRCFIMLFLAMALLNGCSSSSSATNPVDQSLLARQTEEVEKLRSAEYQDYLSAMRFEDSDQTLGNYYVRKGAEGHHLIDQLEKGQQVNNAEISHALDNSGSEKYDNRPPVPLDDEIGNGY